MKNLTGTNSLLYFTAICFLFINPFSVYSYNSILYNETEPGLKIHQIIPFRDEMLILHMVKPINNSCVEPRIDLRILHPNGTIGTAKIDYPIPEYNFCYGPAGNFYWFDVYRILPDYLLVLYINSTDLASASYYALLVTRTGDIISDTYIAPASIINGSIYANGYITPHMSEEYGFLFSNYETETVVMWSYFSKPDVLNGEVHLVNNGKFYLKNPLDSYFVFTGFDGSFCFVTANSTDTKSINISEFTIKVYVSFIKPIMNVVNGPFLIYQSTIPYLKVDFLCDSLLTSTGNVCIITLTRAKPNENLEVYLIRVVFQNTGSVFNTKKFTGIELDEAGLLNIRFNYLFYGGFLFLISENVGDSGYKTIQGIIFDNDGNHNGTWDIPQNLKVSNGNSFTSLRNGTMFLSYNENEFTWNVLSTPMPKFIPDDHGYDNPNIKITYPLINSNIPLSTTSISITYHSPIIISTNNISIYQGNDVNSPILRQSIPGNSPYFSYSPDNMTINIKVLESTFNQPNSIYYIVINDNAINDLKSGQPLLGIERNRWKFKTINHQDIFAEDAVGQFSLTTDGTKYFENLLLHNNQTEFLSRLRIDLAKSIPVDINRLDNIKCCEHDTNQPPKILLNMLIKSTINPNERSVDHIIKDLNILIKSKEVTPISWFGTTNLLETSFGFQRTRNFLDDYKFHLIGIVIGIMILSLLYVYAKKRYPMGKNIVIFKLSLFILNIILNIAFILNNGKKVPKLFIPSVIFCAIPISINSMMSMTIILQEITRNKHFYEWFKNNTNLAALFTILAGANLEVLNILSSQVAGIMSFNAPISKKSRSYIFWGSQVGFFIADIPQFIIQVFYRKLTVTYDIIPFLALLTSSIILANNIVSRIYHAIILLRLKSRLKIDDSLKKNSRHSM